MGLWHRLKDWTRDSGAEAPEPWRAIQAVSAQGTDGDDRISNGIEDLLTYLGGDAGMDILDLGAASPHTLTFLGGLGHHIHCVSLLEGVDKGFHAGSKEAGPITHEAAFMAIQKHLRFEEGSIHAVLAWDVLQHLDSVTMQLVIDCLARVLRSDGIMFCLFNAAKQGSEVPVFRCSVTSKTTVTLRSVEKRTLQHEFHARALEELFPQYRAVHFYLKRDHLVELLVFR